MRDNEANRISPTDRFDTDDEFAASFVLNQSMVDLSDMAELGDSPGASRSSRTRRNNPKLLLVGSLVGALICLVLTGIVLAR